MEWEERWTGDFNFESKREIIRVKKENSRRDAETRREEGIVINPLSASAPLREND